MSIQTWSSIEDVEFAGGWLCLDFINTTGNRAHETPRERLHDRHSWQVFLKRSGLLQGQQTPHAVGENRFRTGELPRIRDCREALFRLITAAHIQEEPTPEDQVLFAHWIKQIQQSKTPKWSQGTLQLIWQDRQVTTENALLQIVDSALELLTTDACSQLKQCGNCDWFFLDISKNRSRRWCRKTCGDRVKSRRYYANQKANKER